MAIKKLLSKKRVIIVTLTLMLLLSIGVFLSKFINVDGGVSELRIEAPSPVSTSDESFVVDVTVSKLGEAIYPAASMSIAFDPSRLEFLGVDEGNVFVGTKEDYNLPKWSCNVSQSNKTGLINVMYLDTTSGTKAFCKELIEVDYNVVLRLKFRPRGSLRPGDICTLVVEDAVFAASDESQSLAMTTKTLKAKNGKIAIGE